ncbi:hypothetical protein [Paenibacillus sp. CAA11]|uniref:hypothetical protein n=1 Tax=Paenibacillus sp. CAA11 TaxID=1532905 RepID=UPI001F1D64B0|nr:hypothetical protein [Paenibacillus sp. CAA11]
MQALFEGYGSTVLVQKSKQIQLCCLKMALGDIHWGTCYHNPRIAAYGHDLLKVLSEDREWIVT